MLKDEEARQIDDSGTRIATTKGITEALVNLPREFQRWNKYYKKNEGYQLATRELEITTTTK